MPDKNFDELAESFAKNIYDDPKGQIRLQLVRDELLEVCPQLTANKPLRILDVGCGMGQISTLLAELGHQVTCCDISETMLAETRRRLSAVVPAQADQTRFIHASVQTLDQHLDKERFDFIVFHAVLEWLEEPEAGLQSLLRWLTPDGTLSLMFYNRHSLIFKNLLRGNFSRMDQKNFRGQPGGLTPINPLDPDEVEQWLSARGLRVSSRRGIRCFYDYMDHAMRHQKSSVPAEEIIRMEKEYGVREPYRHLARYLLLHCSLR